MLNTDHHEQLQLDYNQTTTLVRDLADTRFKLVALVPTISGAAVALLSQHPSAAQLLAVGGLGLTATLGVVIYELRNTQVYEYLLQRAALLERELSIRSVFAPAQLGGLFGERPGRDLRVFGLEVAQDRGLALVYAAAIGGWAYLLSWGALHLLGLHESQRAGGGIAVVTALIVLIEFLHIGSRHPSGVGGSTASAPGNRQSTQPS